jgi:Carboxypeptidase regulatory-like domain
MRWFAPQSRVVRMIVLITSLAGTAASNRLYAQSASGTVVGNVTDPSGAAVAATITATNQDTGVVRNTATSADGIYNVPSLLPGNYTIEARAPGFGPVQAKDVAVRVGSDTRVDLTLQLGPLAETLTVTEAVPLVGTTDVDVSQVLDALVIKSIPLNARDVQQLAVIQPGVQYLNTSGYGGRSLTVAGSRPIDNRYLQEGMDMMFTYRVSPFNLASGLILGVEAVKEFKVLTTNQSAEYGEASGGVVNVLFKSGANRLHGSGYEFYRNDIFDARNFFDAAGTPPLHRHQFGASLGGPIRRDKTFFFVNYEGLRESLSRTFVANVPDTSARAGIVPCSGAPTAALPVGTGACPTGTATGIPVTLDPALPQNANMIAVRQIFFGGSNPLFPVCNGPSLGGGLCQHFSNPLEKTQQNYVMGKIDHTFSATNTLSAHYNFDTGWRTTPGELGATADDRINRRQTFTIQDTHIVTRYLVNTARLGVNRIWYNDEKFFLGDLNRVDPRLFAVKSKVPCATRCSEPQPDFPSGIVTPPPTITAAGGLTTFGGTTQAFNFAPRWVGYTTGMLSDDVSYLHGKHAIQAGIQLKRWYDNIDQLRGNPLGQWTFANLTQFLRGAHKPFPSRITTRLAA